MTKNKILRVLSCILIGYIYLPVVSENIPLPGVWFGALALYTLGVLWSKPKLFLSRQFLPLYALLIIYLIFAPSQSYNPESKWLTRRIIPIYTGLSLYLYYFNFSKDIKGIRIIFWFAFFTIIASCITTLIGLEKFPNASRELSSSVYGDIEMAKYYYRIGIVGYGFISALAYFIPIAVLLYKKQDWNKHKYFYLLAILLTSYTVLKAQYTTQFLLFILSLLLSFFGASFFNKYKILIIIPILLLILIPQESYIKTINNIAERIPGNILKERIYDLAETIKEDELEGADTHVGRRYERIPFLISEFLKNPIFGGGESTGHVFWLDHLSLYGLVGAIPWFILLRDNYRRIKKIIGFNFYYYQVGVLAFILLGFMKGSGNREQFILLFFILPSGIFLYENRLLLNTRKYKSAK